MFANETREKEVYCLKYQDAPFASISCVCLLFVCFIIIVISVHACVCVFKCKCVYAHGSQRKNNLGYCPSRALFFGDKVSHWPGNYQVG